MHEAKENEKPVFGGTPAPQVCDPLRCSSRQLVACIVQHSSASPAVCDQLEIDDDGEVEFDIVPGIN